MKYINFVSKYDKSPIIKVKNYDGEAYQGYDSITSVIKEKIKSLNKKKVILTFDCYMGVRYEEILNGIINKLDAKKIVFSDDYAYSGEEITKMIERNLTDDRVFGVLSVHNLVEFFDIEKVAEVKKSIDEVEEGLIVIYGVGASLISSGDILVYLDLARWEIQQRYRSQEFGNWKMDNYDEDILRKYKRGFFVEWRVSDRHKSSLYSQIDFYLDTNKKNDPKMITGEAFLAALKQATNQPFRLVPYFDPGVWGGQWLKEVCHLDKSNKNYAWSFEAVPEENSVYYAFGDIIVESPAINIVLKHPVELLGDRVHARFGTEFPIRFDYLDTVEGGNLSLQVHPLTEYIQQTFGMHYTQDESYYIMHADETSTVYLGLKENIDKDEMINDLKRAEKGEIIFPDEKYINKFPVKKHDHISIPAGTIHCSGTNTMVLEISSTPYIFTFKLWDWGRLGLDGRPRPVHINHGEKAIQWDRDTKWVKENLLNRVEVISETDGIKEERTGLHERQFIETRRHWFSKPVLHKTNGTVNVLCLVEGEEAIIESPTNAFEPFVVHYAETFVIPANVEEYIIRPYGNSEGKEIVTIKAYVR